MSKLTEHELMKRLDNEFPDVDFLIQNAQQKELLQQFIFMKIN